MSTSTMFPLGYESHDPGGRTRLKLQPGVIGGATFSPCRRYRHTLWRRWGEEGVDSPYMLWIGCNPSTAEEDCDDPTVRREIGFTRKEGVTGYVKCNVADYRATDPDVLLRDDVEPRSAENLPTILLAAMGASRVVLAFGAVRARIRDYAEETVYALRNAPDGPIPMWCVGTTAGHHPRHPLYVRSDTPLMEWKGWR